MKKTLFLICFLLSITYSFSQLTVTSGIPPATLVQDVLVGGGVTISSITYTGHANAIGKFQTGGNPTNLGITEGIIMSSGVVNGTPAIGSPVSGFASSSNGTSGDALLNSLISGTTNDAAVLQFDFVPLSDTLRFRYVFGSEEYPEWVGSTFNDVFGFFVTGPNPMGGTYTNRNIALIPNTMTPVAINNIHSGSYSQYFVNNQGLSGQTIVFDGFTTVLTAWLKVTPCQTYHIKLAIADAGDSSFDSAVFLEANSFGTSGIIVDTEFSIPAIGNFAVEGCNDVILNFCLPQTSPNNYIIPIQIGGTATNGVDYTMIPSQITIPAGSLCTEFTIEAFIDNVDEGIENIEIIIQTNMCGDYDTINIAIHDYSPLQVTTSNDTTICLGDSTQIIAAGILGISPYEYAWDNIPDNTTTQTVSPDAATTYTVTVSDMCSQTATADIQIQVSIVGVDAGDDVTICENEAVNLTATGGTSYIWSTGATTATITVSPAQETTYFVTATGVCFPHDSVTVFISPSPNITLSQPPTVCAGEQIQITASGGESYAWSSNPPDGTLVGQNTNETINVKPKVTTVYTVIALNSFGCTNSAQVIAEIYPAPQADFLIDPLIISSFDPIVTFTDISRGNPIVWDWDFGDQTNSDVQNPVHIFSEDGGTYSVLLIVTNIYGCIDSIRKDAFVKPDFVIYVPNAFSPGGNGINDEIGIFSTGVSKHDFHWIIFNRWGNIVFESFDLHQSWNGKMNGSKLPAGFYTYKIFFRDNSNITHEKYEVF